MTSPPRRIEVTCPACGETYQDWWWPSVNLALDDFEEEYLEEASSAIWPACGYRVRLDQLVVEEDGTFRWPEGEGP